MIVQAINEPIKDDWDKIMGDLPVYQIDENEVLSKDNKSLKYTVTIIQPTSAVIEVYVEGESSPRTSTFQAVYDSVYTVKFKDNNNPEGLLLNVVKGKVTRDITIYANEDSSTLRDRNKKYNINIVQVPNQTIGVSCNGQIKTQSFSAKQFSYYVSNITPNAGYNPGKLNIASGILTEDVTITATAATKIITDVVVNIVQSNYQTITVAYTINGKTTNYQRSFVGKSGGKIKASILSTNVAYNPGILNIVEKTLEDDDITIKATAAQIKKFTITIEQYSHQQITVTGFGSAKTATFENVPYNTILKATIKATTTGYSPGKLNASSYTVINNFTFKADKEATLGLYKVSVTQSNNQTITLTRKDTGATSTTGWNDIPYGTIVTASIKADSGYNAGTLNATSKTITGAFTFSASAAQSQSGYAVIYRSQKTNITIPSGINKVQVAFWWHYRSDERARLGNGDTIADKWDKYKEYDPEGGDYWSYGWTGGEYDEDEAIWNINSRKTWWEKRFLVTHTAVLNGKTYTEKPSCYIKVTPGKTYTLSARSGNYKGRYSDCINRVPDGSCYCFLVIWSPEINNTTPSTIKSDL